MNTFQVDQDWFASLIPEGLPYPSSTIISGPAGSAKPIIESILTASWIRKGGTVILLLLSTDRPFSERVLDLFQIEPAKIRNNIKFITLNPEVKTVNKITDNEYEANLVMPESWNMVLDLEKNFPLKTETGTLISGSSLNMLLFSNTYRLLILEKIKQIMDQTHCVFCLSDNVFAKEMKQLADKADNLIYAHASGIMHLNLKILRMKDVPFSGKEIRVPIKDRELDRLLHENQKARQRHIPKIRKL